MAILQHELMVYTDQDLIDLRQLVRRAARELGLSTIKQARFTAAVSEVARELLTKTGESQFVVQCLEPQSRHAMLEVICEATSGHGANIGRLLNHPNLASARHLTDETRLIDSDHGPRLALRMRLHD